jgi:hypothetical protein
MEDYEIEDGDCKFDDVIYYISTGSYPDRMKGNPGLKSNLRRQACRFTVKDGALYYKHKTHRSADDGKCNIRIFNKFTIKIK